MNTIEIVWLYDVEKWTLRMIAEKFSTDHHRIRRILVGAGVQITKRNTLKPYTQEHRDAVGRASKGRVPWSKGKRMPKKSLYKNMAAHLRFSVTAKWLGQFEDVERLKFLNRAISHRSGRFNITSEEYKAYLIRFYNDTQFISLYEKWIASGHEKWMRPTLDHMVPRAAGGLNNLENLQFLSWFENRTKCNMTQDEWDAVKANLQDYLV